MYTTWSEDETIVWEPYHPLSTTEMWGVYDEFLIDPVPEPPVGLPAFAALVILVAWRRRFYTLATRSISRNSRM